MLKTYHTTTKSRIASILQDGLVPGSNPTWFISPAPYVLVSKEPWNTLNGEESIVIEISDPDILSVSDEFWDSEGLRWPKTIKPEYLKIL